VWEEDIDGAQNFSEALPTEGQEALIDRTDYPMFRAAAQPAGAKS